MKKILIAAILLLVTACDASKPELQKTIAQLQQTSAQKDSLLQDVLATTQFIANANTELSKVRSSTKKVILVTHTETTPTLNTQRAQLLARITAVATGLNKAQSRIAISKARIAVLDSSNTMLKSQIAAFDSTITALNIMVVNQKIQVSDLTTQINNLQTENAALKMTNVGLLADKDTLTLQRNMLTKEKNTVYYVIGTKKDLLQKGIIVQKGGILGLGKMQVLATNLNTTNFTSIDKTVVNEIPLPNKKASYQIISRQDVSALATMANQKKQLQDSIKIMNSEKFWAASKFLVVIEQ